MPSDKDHREESFKTLQMPQCPSRANAQVLGLSRRFLEKEMVISRRARAGRRGSLFCSPMVYPSPDHVVSQAGEESPRQGGMGSSEELLVSKESLAG